VLALLSPLAPSGRASPLPAGGAAHAATITMTITRISHIPGVRCMMDFPPNIR
jgi:hypothetical protein